MNNKNDKSPMELEQCANRKVNKWTGRNEIADFRWKATYESCSISKANIESGIVFPPKTQAFLGSFIPLSNSSNLYTELWYRIYLKF